ncbi:MULTISPECIES: LLM class flavin-dependent oxidoreductase [unclassified Sphingomonas]|uniref:LLM class flavin-dependent oxidoreductase n=1 Tax=Sphingomonas sp. GC_Shp_5 TaxID=2937379 RepID=UPI00226A826F|nr:MULTISPECIES: LLM class flavin-dependent oxidoreductase [unclassified Sphingomonas]
MREPLIVAKQAASVDQLLGGRFLLGLSTGDRSSEFAAFDSDLDDRSDRYRDAIGVIRAATEQSFARHASGFYGTLDGTIDLVPKPVGPRLPMLAIGRAGQTLEWLGENTDGWIWHLSNPQRLPDVLAQWRAATAGGPYKPYGYGAMFDLLAETNAPLTYANGGIRSGRNALIELWKRQRDEGVAHVTLNLKPSRRPFADVADELATYVLPQFPTDAR